MTGPAQHEDPSQLVLQYIHGHLYTQAVSTAVQSGIIDAIAARGASIDAICHDLGLAFEPTAGLCNALRIMGLVSLSGDRLVLTASGEVLRSGLPLAQLATLNGTWYESFSSDLLRRVQGEKPRYNLWSSMMTNQDLFDSFAQVMENNTRSASTEIVSLLEIPDHGVLVELGAGSGDLIVEVSSKFPNLYCVATERAPMVEVLRSRVGSVDRVRVVEADFFVGVAPADVYLMKSVLHNWPDPTCRDVLAMLRTTSPAARIVVVETWRPSDTLRHAAAQLSMASLFGTRERDPSELTQLISLNGAYSTTVKLSESGYCIVEAFPKS